MSEETRKLVSFPGQPSANEETPQGEAGKGSDSPETFTRKEAENFLESKFQDMAREIQSRTDKSLADVREKVTGITKTLEFLKGQGMEITPEQEKALEDAAMKEALLGSNEDPDTSPQKEKDGQGQPTADPSEPRSPSKSEQSGPLEAEAKRIMQEELGEGTYVFSDDPEAEIINGSKTIEEYLLNVRKAAQQKSKRMNRLPSSPGSSGGPAKGSVMEQDDNTIWKNVKKEL
jgi:hypothetical protein